MEFLVRKCRICGAQYPGDYAQPCEVDFGNDWLFWCEKHEKPAQERGCEDCAFKFRGSLIFTVTELGTVLLENWSDAIKCVTVRSVSDWVVETCRDRALADRIRKIDQDDEISCEDKFSFVVMLLRSDSVLCWHGNLVDMNWLCSNYDQALQLLKSDFAARAARLGLGAWLFDLKMRWESLERKIHPEGITSVDAEQAAFVRLLSEGAPNDLSTALSIVVLVPRLQLRRLSNLKGGRIGEIANQRDRDWFAQPGARLLNELFTVVCRGIQDGVMPALESRSLYEATFILARRYEGKALVEHEAFRQILQAHLKTNFSGHFLRSLVASYLRDFSQGTPGFVAAMAQLIRSYLLGTETPEFSTWRALDSAYGLFLGSEAPRRCAERLPIRQNLEEGLRSLGLTTSVLWAGFSSELMLEWVKTRKRYSIDDWKIIQLWFERCAPALAGREYQWITATILPWTRKAAPKEIRSEVSRYLIEHFKEPREAAIWEQCPNSVRETVSEWRFLEHLEAWNEAQKASAATKCFSFN